LVLAGAIAVALVGAWREAEPATRVSLHWPLPARGVTGRDVAPWARWCRAQLHGEIPPGRNLPRGPEVTAGVVARLAVFDGYRQAPEFFGRGSDLEAAVRAALARAMGAPRVAPPEAVKLTIVAVVPGRATVAPGSVELGHPWRPESGARLRLPAGWRLAAAGALAEEGKTRRLLGGLREEPVTVASLRDASRRGGEFLLKHLRPDGEFDYLYDPVRDLVPDDYEIVRHAGTAYSLAELAGDLGEPRFLEACDRALEYMRPQWKTWPGEGPEARITVVDGPYTKLGSTALALLAHVERARVSGDRDDLPRMRRMAEQLLTHQEPSGRFGGHRLEFPSGVDVGSWIRFFPGEAQLALARLYELDPDPRWLEAARRGVEFSIADQVKAVLAGGLTSDHWLHYAMEAVDRHAPDPSLAAHSALLAAATLSIQQPTRGLDPERGAYRKGARGPDAGALSEGLAAAWFHQVRVGNLDGAALILAGLRRAAAFQMRTQIRVEQAMETSRPDLSLGGFRGSLFDPLVRIDFVQHNVSALLALARILEGKHPAAPGYARSREGAE
jgi:hypothetical protein